MNKDKIKEIYCCGCSEKVNANLINGAEAYPHRKDLYKLNFWRCPRCLNFVGCHKNSRKNAPLGNIPTKELKFARTYIHSILDPMWQCTDNPRFARDKAYSIISEYIGWSYHTAQIRNVGEARKIYKFIKYELPKLITNEVK